MIQLHRGLDHARPLLVFEAKRLEALASDLRGIAEGQEPERHHLENSPALGMWSFVARSVPTIVGIGQRHPRLPNGYIQTTEIIAVDLIHGWARTLSRYYVLGEENRDGC